MKPEQRYEWLAAADTAALEPLADEIIAACARVSVRTGPESVSAPVRVPVPGAGDTTVVLGHVALTRCAVLLDDTRGDGIRSGYDPVGALSAAICDAECERGGPLSGRVREVCQAAERDRAHRDDERARRVAATRLSES